MERNDGIIDVTPVDHSSEQQPPHAPSAKTAAPRAGATPKAENYYTFDGTSWHPGANPAQAAGEPRTAVPVDARVIDPAAQNQPKSRLGGAVRMAAGGVCTLAGIPMLILPGPGLLAIGGGVYLMASGAKRLFGK